MGAGVWGRNLVRVMRDLECVELKWVVDPAPEALAHARAIAPDAEFVEDISSVPLDVPLVVVSTPARDHANHAISLLAQGRDVLVEKPFALNISDAQALSAHSRKEGAVLMVGHQLLYHPVFQRLEALVHGGALGKLLRVNAERTGIVDLEREPGVLWSFGPHDVAMTLALAGEEPSEISASGKTRTGSIEIAETADIRLAFPTGLQAEVHLSAVDPVRTRRFVAVGEKSTAVFDDSKPGGRLHVYEGEPRDVDSIGVLSEDGDRQLDVPFAEPLAVECAHFVECALNRSEPVTGPEHALAVSKVLAVAAEFLPQS